MGLTVATIPAPDEAHDGDELRDQLRRRANHVRRTEGGDPWIGQHQDKPRPPRPARLSAFLCLFAHGMARHFSRAELLDLWEEAGDDPAARARINAAGQQLKGSAE